jgi:hypothetical protein
MEAGQTPCSLCQRLFPVILGHPARWLRFWLHDPLLRRSVCAAGQPAFLHVSRYIQMSGSDREFPSLTG